jgi:hypothetical protein
MSGSSVTKEHLVILKKTTVMALLKTPYNLKITTLLGNPVVHGM